MIVKYIFFFLIFIHFVQAYSIGVFPVNDSFVVKPFNKYKFTFYLFNPSDKDLNVSINFTCFLGNKVYENTKFLPKNILIERHTSITNPKMILVIIENPVFLKKEIFFKENKITYLKPIVGEEYLKCRFYAILEEKTTLIVTANLNGKIVGLNIIKILTILFLLFMFSLAFYLSKNKNTYKKHKKTKNHKT